MYRTKNLIKTVAITSVVAAIPSVISYAGEKQDMQLNCVAGTNGKSVKISIESVNSIANSFQLSLKVEGNVKFSKIDFSSDIKNSATTNVKYNENSNTIDIFVTSNSNLVKNSIINIGEIFVEGSVGNKYTIVDNVVGGKNSIILVTDTFGEISDDNLDEVGSKEITIGKEEIKPENPNPPTGGGSTNPTPEKPQVQLTTLRGENRYETAVKISRDGWQKSDTVIIVNGDNKKLVDGLAATPLASIKNAPILLSNNNELPKQTVDEIKRLNPSKVIAIGGESAMPNKVVNSIKSINSNIVVQRIGGQTRYETSLNIAKEIDKTNNITKIYVGAGYGEADSLSISPVAGKEKAPIILTQQDGLDQKTYEYIKSQNVVDGYIIGGKSKVSDKAINQIDAITSKDISNNRISGDSRQDTNAKVLEKFYGNTQLEGVVLAKDYDLVDALSVGPLAAKKDMPVVLATKDISKSQEEILIKKKSTKIYEIGGGIESSAINKLKNLLNK